MKSLKTWVAAATLLGLTGTVSAAPVFQGRLADGTASTTCTSNGAGDTTKCAMFYNTTLNITILNNWSIGFGIWSNTAAAGSAQALVESVGLAQTGLTGWFLPTGDGSQVAGPLNQYLSIWNAVGSSLAGLQAQFDGVRSNAYWSGSDFGANNLSWYFSPDGGVQAGTNRTFGLFAVAVRPGDVTASVPAASVPEPQTLALALLALGATAVARRRRPA